MVCVIVSSVRMHQSRTASLNTDSGRYPKFSITHHLSRRLHPEAVLFRWILRLEMLTLDLLVLSVLGTTRMSVAQGLSAGRYGLIFGTTFQRFTEDQFRWPHKRSSAQLIWNDPSNTRLTMKKILDTKFGGRNARLTLENLQEFRAKINEATLHAIFAQARIKPEIA